MQEVVCFRLDNVNKTWYIREMDISKEDKTRYAGKKGFNDKECRDAFKRFMKENQTLNNFVFKYMKLKNDGQYKVIDDPLGKYSVDLGVVNTKSDEIVGLVEVDYFSSWGKLFPSYYRYCHRLQRKEKYYKNNNYPYINITWNTLYTAGIVSTRELEQEYEPRYKYFKMKGHYDWVREIPLNKSLTIGKFVKG
mgnify:CR=1 FL=1